MADMTCNQCGCTPSLFATALDQTMVNIRGNHVLDAYSADEIARLPVFYKAMMANQHAGPKFVLCIRCFGSLIGQNVPDAE
jgi:hypothetical protein